MKAFQPMVDLELSDDEKLDAILPIPTNKPDYPPGTTLCLTTPLFKKLGLDPADAVQGGIFHGHFLARVTHTSTCEGPDGETCHRVEAQLVALAIESEDAEDAEYDQ